MQEQGCRNRDAETGMQEQGCRNRDAGTGMQKQGYRHRDAGTEVTSAAALADIIALCAGSIKTTLGNSPRLES